MERAAATTWKTRRQNRITRLLAEWALANGVRLFIGQIGSCHDNAVSESFFATLKKEMFGRRRWATRREARMAVVGYIEGYCNRRRPHLTIGYRIPAQVMQEYFDGIGSGDDQPGAPEAAA